MSGTSFKTRRYTLERSKKFPNKRIITHITPDEVLRNPFTPTAGRPFIRKTKSSDPRIHRKIISKHIDLHAESDDSANGILEVPFMRNGGLPPIRRVIIDADKPKYDTYIKHPDMGGNRAKLATDSKLKRLNAFFAVSFLFPTRYKDVIDHIKLEQQLKTRSLSVIKPLPAPEFPLYGRVPIERLESAESAIRQLVAHQKPFEVQFTPHYSRVTHENFKRDKRPGAENYQVGLELTSVDDEHVKLSNEMAKAIWPTKKAEWDKRRILVIQPDMKTSEEARTVWRELLDQGIKKFMVKGLVLTSQIFLEKEMRYHIDRRVFLLQGKEKKEVKTVEGKPGLNNAKEDLRCILRDTETADSPAQKSDVWPTFDYPEEVPAPRIGQEDTK